MTYFYPFFEQWKILFFITSENNESEGESLEIRTFQISKSWIFWFKINEMSNKVTSKMLFSFRVKLKSQVSKKIINYCGVLNIF